MDNYSFISVAFGFDHNRIVNLSTERSMTLIMHRACEVMGLSARCNALLATIPAEAFLGIAPHGQAARALQQ